MQKRRIGMGNEGKTVNEILFRKRASVRNAPLPAGFPGWAAIGDMVWEELVERARRAEPGFREVRKLLSDKRFDK